MHSVVYEIIVLIIIVCLLDSLYIYHISTPFKNMIENIQQSKLKINLIGLVLCYIFLCVCIYYFVWKKKLSFIESFALGFIIYAVFDSTNYTLFKDWNLYLSIIDSIWGGILFLISNIVMNILF